MATRDLPERSRHARWYLKGAREALATLYQPLSRQPGPWQLGPTQLLPPPPQPPLPTP